MANKNLPYEKNFQKWFNAQLKKIPNSWGFKSSDRSTAGIPDDIWCVAGLFFAFELKTRTKVTPIQAYTLRRIDEAGGQSFVVTPDNAHEVLEYVKKVALLGVKRP